MRRESRDLGMPSRIIPGNDLIVTSADDLVIFNDYATEWAAFIFAP